MSLKKISSLLVVSATLSALCLFAGCTKSSTEATPDPDPVFLVTSSPVTITDADNNQYACVTFTAKPNLDIVMSKVIIKDPLDVEVATFNANNTLILKDTQNGCQTEGEGYIKKGGDWTLTFVGKVNSTNKSFSISKKVSVSAR